MIGKPVVGPRWCREIYTARPWSGEECAHEKAADQIRPWRCNRRQYPRGSGPHCARHDVSDGVGRRRAVRLRTGQGAPEKTAAALAVVLLLSGCVTKPSLYAWGQYEELIYLSYKSPKAMPPEEQVKSLEQDFQKVRAANQHLPCGWHAHLGYLYSQIGQFDRATSELRLEKAEFPESTVFVDHLLANLAKP